MEQQLLWIETLLKSASALTLLVAPGLATRALGLPPASPSFWPRLLGGVLAGIAAAFYIQGARQGSLGLGLGGAIAINLSSAAVLAALVALKAGAPTRRGHVVLLSIIGLLVLLSLFEIAALS